MISMMIKKSKLVNKNLDTLNIRHSQEYVNFSNVGVLFNPSSHRGCKKFFSSVTRSGDPVTTGSEVESNPTLTDSQQAAQSLASEPTAKEPKHNVLHTTQPSTLTGQETLNGSDAEVDVIKVTVTKSFSVVNPGQQRDISSITVYFKIPDSDTKPKDVVSDKAVEVTNAGPAITKPAPKVEARKATGLATKPPAQHPSILLRMMEEYKERDKIKREQSGITIIQQFPKREVIKPPLPNTNLGGSRSSLRNKSQNMDFAPIAIDDSVTSILSKWKLAPNIEHKVRFLRGLRHWTYPSMNSGQKPKDPGKYLKYISERFRWDRETMAMMLSYANKSMNECEAFNRRDPNSRLLKQLYAHRHKAYVSNDRKVDSKVLRCLYLSPKVRRVAVEEGCITPRCASVYVLAVNFSRLVDSTCDLESPSSLDDAYTKYTLSLGYEDPATRKMMFPFVLYWLKKFFTIHEEYRDYIRANVKTLVSGDNKKINPVDNALADNKSAHNKIADVAHYRSRSMKQKHHKSRQGVYGVNKIRVGQGLSDRGTGSRKYSTKANLEKEIVESKVLNQRFKYNINPTVDPNVRKPFKTSYVKLFGTSENKSNSGFSTKYLNQKFNRREHYFRFKSRYNKLPKASNNHYRFLLKYLFSKIVKSKTLYFQHQSDCFFEEQKELFRIFITYISLFRKRNFYKAKSLSRLFIKTQSRLRINYASSKAVHAIRVKKRYSFYAYKWKIKVHLRRRFQRFGFAKRTRKVLDRNLQRHLSAMFKKNKYKNLFWLKASELDRKTLSILWRRYYYAPAWRPFVYLHKKNKLFFNFGDKYLFGRFPLHKYKYPLLFFFPRYSDYRRLYKNQLKEQHVFRWVYRLKFSQLIKRFRKSIAGTKRIFELMFLKYFEFRLDTIVYRLNFAFSLKHARQLVNRGLFMLNNKTIHNYAYHMSLGDVIMPIKRVRLQGTRLKYLNRKAKGYFLMNIRLFYRPIQADQYTDYLFINERIPAGMIIKNIDTSTLRFNRSFSIQYLTLSLLKYN